MSQLKYLVDSVILIDHLNQIDEATEFLSLNGEKCAISIVGRTEILAGCEEPDFKTIADLLEKFELLTIDRVISDMAARLRRQRNWKLPDAFQAATAKVHSLKLVTRNTKDFHPQKDSFVLVPYQI